MKRKTAVLFPGIGYTCERPLLHEAGKLAEKLGYEIKKVAYTGFPEKVRGDKEKMKECAYIAAEQSEVILKDMDWSGYETIVFIGKSVGTIAAAAYAEKHHLSVQLVFLTPVKESFSFQRQKNTIVFHGTADPWADTEDIVSLSRQFCYPLFLVEGANHSLLKGQAEEDEKNLYNIMNKLSDFLINGSAVQ